PSTRSRRGAPPRARSRRPPAAGSTRTGRGSTPTPSPRRRTPPPTSAPPRSSSRPSPPPGPGGCGPTPTSGRRTKPACPSATRWRSRERGGRSARPRRREPPSAADPLQLADRAADRRHLPLHRVGDHALRLVLHRLLLRPRRQQRAPVAADRPPDRPPVRAPCVRSARQHVHPRHLELHNALGDGVREAEPPRRAPGGHGADDPDRLYLLSAYGD